MGKNKFHIKEKTMPPLEEKHTITPIEKSPDTSGWGYAQFLYDASSDTFKPFGSDSSFGKNVCYQCHTAVTARDFIFTDYPRR
jgi:hypothetical protein